ncbi:MAG: GNAT family N-acetyltransferase [Bacilli bacterium]|nr:GNAT family N-acetyltransferase [Bacilli bacterium]
MNAIFKLNGLTLETERLLLRPFCNDDLEDFYEYASVEGVGEFAGWPHHESKDISIKILENFIKEDKTFAIVCKENNKVIGSLGIEKYRCEESLPEFDGYIGREIGFVLSKDYWRNGYMTEAVRKIIDYLFKTLDYDFIICGHSSLNPRSQRVQEKCGFKPYRKIDCHVIFGNNEDCDIINLLINPSKNISFNFSHPETLIWEE